MLSILKRFFDFCTPEDRKKLLYSIVLGVLKAFIVGLRIPAIALVVTAIIANQFSMETVWWSFAIMLTSVVLNLLITLKITMLQTEAGYHTCTQKRIEIAEHIRYLPMGFFNHNSLGKITSITTNTLEALTNIATRVIMVTTQGLLTTFVITCFVLIYDWRVGLLLTAGFFIFLIPNTLMQKSTVAVSSEMLQANTQLVDTVLEYVQGIAEVKNYNLTKNSSRALAQAIKRKKKVDIDLTMQVAPWISIQGLVNKFTGTAMIIGSLFFFLQGSMDLLTCIMMVISAFMVYESLDSVSSFSSLLRSVDLSVKQVQEVLDLEPMDISGQDLTPKTSHLELKEVEFSYGGRKIIDKVSLSIPEQTTTAIVGPSGSGKTTLCNLMARFWDVEGGSITLDGKDIRDYSYDSLIRNFSFVFQKVYLFEDTIENNIKFGKEHVSHEEVIEAAKKACCHDFILSLRDGYKTRLGEGGARLSGGEKQRISIARAMLKDAPIIILDEATANVDPENEAELIKAIQALTHNKTIIMIAHRLKTVEQADQIIVLDQGRIVQQGKHQELLEQEGLYKNFVNTRRHALSWKLA